MLKKVVAILNIGGAIYFIGVIGGAIYELGKKAGLAEASVSEEVVGAPNMDNAYRVINGITYQRVDK